MIHSYCFQDALLMYKFIISAYVSKPKTNFTLIFVTLNECKRNLFYTNKYKVKNNNLVFFHKDYKHNKKKFFYQCIEKQPQKGINNLIEYLNFNIVKLLYFPKPSLLNSIGNNYVNINLKSKIIKHLVFKSPL